MPRQDETPPEKEAELAREAMATGDLPRAVRHIGAALRHDPERTEWVRLLDDALERMPDVAHAVQAEGPGWEDVAAAARARSLAPRGQLAQALELLAEATLARPEAPFLVWATEWLRRPGAAGSLRIDYLEGSWVPRLLRVLNDVPAPMPAGEPRERTVKAAAQVLEALGQSHPGSALLLLARSFALRRLGRADEAGSLAYQAYQKRADWNSAVAVGLAHRDCGRIEDAANWLRHALTFDPQDLSARLDLGDTFLEAGRWEEAIATYREVLERQPEHLWAKPSAIYAAYRQHSRPEDKGALFLLAQRSARAWDLFTRIEPDQPFLNHLPPASEPLVDALREHMEQLQTGPLAGRAPRFDVPLEHPPSPSALVAFRLWSKAHDLDFGPALTIAGIPTPDPRFHKAAVDFVLWTWEGNTPKRTTGAADPTVSAAIARIARLPYHLELWEPLARELGERLGTDRLHQLLAVMVDPPALPAPDRDPFDWMRRVQIAAALVIGYLEPDWEPSHRKRALYALLVGPVDWAVEAAVVALAWLGREESAVCQDASQLFGWMAQQVPADAPPCFEYALACAALWMGGADPATVEQMTAWRRSIEERRRSGRARGSAGQPAGRG